MGEGATPGDISRLTVPQAAEALGISTDAVRNRLSRGTLRSVKEAGTVYVLLEADRLRQAGDRSTDRPVDTSAALLEQMQGRIDSLEHQLEAERQAHGEARRIIAGLVERIPAIEAPGSPETAVDEEEGPSPRPDAPGEQEAAGERPWWRRMFGG